MARKKQYTVVGQFPSSTEAGKTYVVKEDEKGQLSCSCPAWIFKKPSTGRTCPHVEDVLGQRVQRDMRSSLRQLDGGSLGDIFSRLEGG